MDTYKRYNSFSDGLFTGIVEVWKDIPEYEGSYQVSSFGRVKSMSRLRLSRSGSFSPLPERIMVPKTNKSGYLVIGLRKQGVRRFFTVHRLVASAFIANPGSKPTVNHKNGIKSDNRTINLEWSTHSEQMVHAVAHNLLEKRGAPKFTKAQKKEMLAFCLANPTLSVKQLADILKTSERTISRLMKDGVSPRTTVCRTKTGTVTKQVRSSSEIKEILELRKAGFTLQYIGQKYDLGTSQVWRICKGLSRNNNYEE